MIEILVIGAAAMALSKKSDDSSGLIYGFKPEIWRKYDSYFKKHGAVYGVDWRWLKAIALNESSLGTHPTVALGEREPANVDGSKSYDGKSWGVMQVTLTTARDMDAGATVAKLNNADYSIKIAAQYLSWLKRYFSPNDSRYIEFLIKSYNQGPGNSQKEKAGQSSGFAGEYWSRFVRNLEKVEARA